MIRSKDIQIVPISEIRPNPKNRNSHSKEQIERLVKIIEYQGFRAPLIVSNLSGYLIAGHGRLEAAKKLGMEAVPVTFQDFEDETQEYAAMVSDNAIAFWSELMLSDINADIIDFGPELDLDLLGIKNFTLDPADKEGQCDEDDVPEKVEPKTKLGDLYRLGDHRLLCGDSTLIDNVTTLVGSERMDMVFTDPPYGVSYEKKTQQIANQSKSRYKSTISGDDLGLDGLKDIISMVFSNLDMVLAEKSSYYVCSPQGGDLGLMMMMMQEANLPCRHMIIWVKNAPVFSMGRLDYDYKHEPILYGWSPNRTHNKIMGGEMKSSVWEVSREPNKEHPTMKPLALPENAIKNSCPVFGNVIDLFGGSGSTLIACEKTNRKCFMMEIDPHYCDVIVSRWEKYTGRKAELING